MEKKTCKRNSAKKQIVFKKENKTVIFLIGPSFVGKREFSEKFKQFEEFCIVSWEETLKELKEKGIPETIRLSLVYLELTKKVIENLEKDKLVVVYALNLNAYMREIVLQFLEFSDLKAQFVGIRLMRDPSVIEKRADGRMNKWEIREQGVGFLQDEKNGKDVEGLDLMYKLTDHEIDAVQIGIVDEKGNVTFSKN